MNGYACFSGHHVHYVMINSAMEESAQTTLLLLIFLLVNTSPLISGSSVEGDCAKDGSCQEKHGKQKYVVKGTKCKLTMSWRVMLYHCVQ